MKKLWNRLPRGLRLALDLAAILILLVCVWAMLGYPALFPGWAYRWGMEDAGLPALEPSLLVDTEKGQLALYEDGETAYLEELQKERFGWTASLRRSCPAVDGVLYMPLIWDFEYPYEGKTDLYRYDEEREVYVERMIPCFAVRAGQASEATLTLVVARDRDRSHTVGGSFRLPLLEKKNDWFLFRFDLADILAHWRLLDSGGWQEWMDDEENYYTAPYNGLIQWMSHYNRSNEGVLYRIAEAHLELTLYDAAGQVLRSVELPTQFEP